MSLSFLYRRKELVRQGRTHLTQHLCLVPLPPPNSYHGVLERKEADQLLIEAGAADGSE